MREISSIEYCVRASFEDKTYRTWPLEDLSDNSSICGGRYLRLNPSDRLSLIMSFGEDGVTLYERDTYKEV